MELTPEERERIYAEEKARAEARALIETEQRKQQEHVQQQAAAQRAARGRQFSKKLLPIITLILAAGAAIAFWARSAIANKELIAALEQAETLAGTVPSDDEWISVYGQASVEGFRDDRGGALLFIQSLRYAVNDERLGSSYLKLGYHLDRLGLVPSAEHCLRLAVRFDPGKDLGREWLADVLMKQKEYDEAIPIYRYLIPRASEPNDRWSLCSRIVDCLHAIGQTAEEAKYKSEADQAWAQYRAGKQWSPSK